MKPEDELKFSFYTKPITYFITAIALLVAAGFIVYSGETSKQGPGFVRFMYNRKCRCRFRGLGSSRPFGWMNWPRFR